MKLSPRTLKYVFFALWLFHFYLGYFLAASGATYTDSCCFGMDNPRVFTDIFMYVGHHYRTNVHPLFVILFQPIGAVFTFFAFGSRPIAALLMTTISATLCAWLLFLCAVRLCCDRGFALGLALLYAFSASQLLFGIFPETYIFSALGLLFIHYALRHGETAQVASTRKMVLLGMVSISVTITNFAQFLILMLAGQGRTRLRRCIRIALIVLVITTGLSLLQKAIYPSSTIFFLFMIDELGKYSVGGEAAFALMDYVKQIFLHGWMLSVEGRGSSLIAKPDIAGTIVAVVINAWLLLLALVALLRHRRMACYTIAACLGFNLALHLFYNPVEAFLYTPHFLFLFLLMAALGYARLSPALKSASRVMVGFLVVVEFTYNMLHFSVVTDTLIHSLPTYLLRMFH